MPEVKTFNLSTWDGFSELPKEGLDYLLDTTALNKKLADRRESPYRWRTASFSIPIGITKAMQEKYCKEAVDKWLLAFTKQGWELASKVQVYPGQKYAFDVTTQAVLLDKTEMRCRAIFKTHPKPVRIELPPGVARQGTGEESTLKQVMKAEGITPVPRNKRENPALRVVNAG